MVTVKGVEVRPEEVVKEIQVNFDELTEKEQKRLFSEHPEEFVEDALRSSYLCMPWLVLKERKKLSEHALNKAIKVLLERRAYEDIILKFLEVPFELDEELKKRLALRCQNDSIQLWLAKDEKASSEILEIIFICGAQWLVRNGKMQVFDSVVMNPNFNEIEEIEIKLKERFSPTDIEKIMARIEFLK